MNLLTMLALATLIPQDPPDPQQLQVLAVPRALAVHRGDVEIRVDGALLEWPALPPLDLDHPLQLSGTPVYGPEARAWAGPGDLSGKAWILWDEEYFYFGGVVRDEWHRPLKEGHPSLDEVPPVDSIVLSFDIRRDTRAIGADEGRAEDREFWLADMDLEENSRKPILWDRFRGTARFIETQGAAVDVGRNPELGLTTYEFRMPWKEILPSSIRPEPGMVFDLQVVIGDYDEITDPMPQTRAGWTFGSGPAIDPGLFGSVMLVRDFDQGADRFPEFPPAPELTGEPVPDPDYWHRFSEQLAAAPPAIFDGKSGPAQESGSYKRFQLLEELESHLARFPRADYLELLHRQHRRMPREVAGLSATGVPFYWRHVLADLIAAIAEPVPEHGFRLHRLPQGGFLIRSKEASFAIDPVGGELERLLWDQIGFVLLTQPLDMTRRSDQLLVRMAAASPSRPVFSHVAYHLPTVMAQDMRLAVPGTTYEVSKLRVKPLGRVAPDGKVFPSASYEVRWPDGTVLVIAEPTFLEEFAPREPIDGLILSARHPRARIVGQRLRAGLTILDDLLSCSIMSGPLGRIRLSDGFKLQQQLLPYSSILLAPGESVDINSRGR